MIKTYIKNSAYSADINNFLNVELASCSVMTKHSLKFCRWRVEKEYFNTGCMWYYENKGRKKPFP
jgi:hypothetical protein